MGIREDELGRHICLQMKDVAEAFWGKKRRLPLSVSKTRKSMSILRIGIIINCRVVDSRISMQAGTICAAIVTESLMIRSFLIAIQSMGD